MHNMMLPIYVELANPHTARIALCWGSQLRVSLCVYSNQFAWREYIIWSILYKWLHHICDDIYVWSNIFISAKGVAQSTMFDLNVLAVRWHKSGGPGQGSSAWQRPREAMNDDVEFWSGAPRKRELMRACPGSGSVFL